MRQLTGMTVLALVLTPFAGPVLATTDYAALCQREIRPKGYYTYESRAAVPVVKPAEGGTQAEADQINACIRSKAYGGKSASAMSSPIAEDSPAPRGVAAQSTAATPHYSKTRRGASVLSGGSGYHGAVLEGGTGYGGTVDQTPPKRRKAPKGSMALPSGYPLLPGDEGLWYSLTPAQQQRAIEFLEDGSTIRSSLMPD